MDTYPTKCTLHGKLHLVFTGESHKDAITPYCSQCEFEARYPSSMSEAGVYYRAKAKEQHSKNNREC